VANDVQEPETVAGHMYRMAMMSFLFGKVCGNADRKTGSCSDITNEETDLCEVDRERYKVLGVVVNSVITQ
jgi:hypothetical protein